MSTVLRSPSADDDATMLALNNEFAVETSLLNIGSLQQLVASSFYVRIAGQMDGFCIALDQDANIKTSTSIGFAANTKDSSTSIELSLQLARAARALHAKYTAI